MKLICPDCGKQYDSGKFCPECGVKLRAVTPELVCPSCGYKAKSGKFCPECGTKLADQYALADKVVDSVPSERTFNEKDPHLTKYYDKKGFPRTIPQEERAIAIEELSSYAKEGISEAKMLLGYLYVCDKNSSQDEKGQGFELIKDAEQDGDKLAYYLMGIAYMGVTDSVAPDHNEAEKRLLEMYQEYHNGDDAQILATLYVNSEAKRDYKKAFEYATIAAEDDEVGGYLILGSLYLNGWGVEKDTALALDNYKMAAALGDETAMNQIGYIFMGNEGVEANPEQAFYWFNESAKKGSDVGMNNLGYCYKDGFGVTLDKEKAAECFKKAAELGYIDSMCELGDYYTSTLFDFDKAEKWLLKAAELGSSDAQNNLGVLYADDIEPNYPEAIKWYKKAMEQDHPGAYRNYAMCLWAGNGTTVDKQGAIEMMEKAKSLGYPDAESELLEMQKAFEQENRKDELHIPEGTRILSKSTAPNNSPKNWSQITTIFLPESLTRVSIDIEKTLPNLSKIVIPTGKLHKFAKMLPMHWWKMYYEDGTSTCPDIVIPSGQLWVYAYGTERITNANGAYGHVIIPPTCSEICKKVFRFNNNILSVTMSDSVDSIGESAFKGCENLKFIRLSNRLTDIPAHMLEDCKSVKEIVIPDGVRSIGKAAFCGCKSLKKITLPQSVTFIFNGGAWGFNPFQLCDSLKQIVVPKGYKEFFQSILKGFSGNPARLLVETSQNNKKKTEPQACHSREVSSKGYLPMDAIKEAANADYPKESLKALAVATLKIAEVINERLPEADVSYMVHPSEFDSSVHEDALPIHFLFKKNGVPKVAVVAVTKKGYKTPLVLETMLSCEDNGIEYIRVYADGLYADWISGWSEVTGSHVTPESVEFCKNWLVDKINRHL